MKDFSNRYIFIFTIVMVTIVAVVLSLAATLLKPAQDKNYEIEKKKSMLESIAIFAATDDVERLYDEHITESVTVNRSGEEIKGTDAFNIDLGVELKKDISQQKLPVFKAVTEDGEDVVIVPVDGTGLWGPIWGYVSLKADMNTIYGVTFDHESETPGLGAEINTSGFENKFQGKKLFEGKEFVSISVLKAGATPSPDHGVDAISGGTITSRSLERMLRDCLGCYQTYFVTNAK